MIPAPPKNCSSFLTLFSPPSRKIPQATDLQAPPPSVRTISSSSPSSSVTSSSLHSKVRTGSHVNSSFKMTSLLSSTTCGPSPSGTLHSENSVGSGSGHLPSLKKPAAVCPLGPGRPKNAAGRPSKPMLKLREEAAAAAALRKRKAPSQEGEHSGPNRNCIILQDRGRPPSSTSTSSSSSTKLTFLSPHPHGQTNGTISPSGKLRPQPSPSDSHSPATKAVWTYRQTHAPLSHSSPLDPPNTANNSHSRGGLGDSAIHRQSGGRGFDQHGLVKKRKVGGTDEHSPSTKPSVHRLPSSSSSSSASSSSPRSNFYPWKDSKSGGLSGGMDKKQGTPKVSVSVGKHGLQQERRNPAVFFCLSVFSLFCLLTVCFCVSLTVHSRSEIQQKQMCDHKYAISAASLVPDTFIHPNIKGFLFQTNALTFICSSPHTYVEDGQ